MHIIKFLHFAGEMPVALPTLYDYFWDGEESQWVPWNNKIPKYIHEPDRKFNEILVPTLDTVRTKWLLQLQVYKHIRGHSKLLYKKCGENRTKTFK